MFKEIQLLNFRGIKNSGNISLAPLTVFTGSEGSGKSSIGHFLTMLKQTAMTTDSTVVLYPGDVNSDTQLGTQSSLWYKKLEGDLTFSYSFDLLEYLVVEDLEKDSFGIPTQFLYGERIEFSCILSNKGTKYPFVKKFSYELYDIDKKVLTATTVRKTLPAKRSDRVQYSVKTDGYELKNKTGRPWLQKAPSHFYGFSNELNTYYKNARELFTLSNTHEEKLRNIYYVGSDRTRFNTLHLWSGLNRYDVGYNGAHTITALLGSKNRQISLGERRKHQSVIDIIDTLLQKMELVHGFNIEEIEAVEHSYSVRVTSRTSKNIADLTEAGSTIAQVLPILVQCFCAPPNSTIVLDGIETHLSVRSQALLADVLLMVLQSKEDSVNRNIQLIVSTHSEPFLRRLQRRIAEGKTPSDSVLAYHTTNHRRGIEIAPLPLLTNNELTDLTPYFTFEDDDRMLDIVVLTDLEATPQRNLERPIKPIPKKSILKAKRGRGRPKGSKNKPKVSTNATTENTPKRGRGRPKGSKNKPKPSINTTTENTPKRGRGRPKGSKNKPKVSTNATTENTPKRGRGRPKGSKNKNKTALTPRSLPTSQQDVGPTKSTRVANLKARHAEKSNSARNTPSS